MSRTITAMFDTRADADAGSARLHQAGVDASSVHVHDKSTHATTGTHSTRKDQGMWASIKNVFLPDEDRHTYEEGIRRGGFLLTATVDDDKTAAAVQALEEANAIDLDERSQQWRSDGWDYAAVDAAPDDDSVDLIPYGTRDTALPSNRYRSYYGADETH